MRLLRYVVFVVFIIVLFVAIYFGYQYFLLANRSSSMSGGNSLLQTVTDNIPLVKTVQNAVTPKVSLVNNSKSFRLIIPNQSDVEKLVDSNNILNNQNTKVKSLTVVASDNLPTGIEQRLNDKTWAKIDTSTTSGVLTISLWLDPAVMKSFQNVDWNGQVSAIIIGALFDQSPDFSNTPVGSRMDAVNKIVTDKIKSDTNKYYFEVTY